MELTPETVTVLRQIMPLKVEPDIPVFINVHGTPGRPALLRGALV
jgi:hypothetical protein